MLYQLPNGRTIQMSIETYFSLSDEDLRSLTGYNCGAIVNNPLFDSSISKEETIDDLTEIIVDPTLEDLSDEFPDVSDITSSEEE